ncbi:MAG: RNA methyltransferase [Prevotella sp.]|nr:RNA methyltransferase [Prevotella sp.]
MISKAAVKLIRSLEAKKHRAAEGLFVAEGAKTVRELRTLAEPVAAYYGDDADKASLQQHPQGELALFSTNIFDKIKPVSKLCLMLDGVQDPGNVGTIIRIADWFGIDRIVCSPSTADFLSPKVVQASMGSIARVRIDCCDLIEALDRLPAGYPVYGTLLDGKNIYNERLTREGIIVLGNEGNGISAAVRRRLTNALLIPSYPPGRATADSLNVAVAAAIVCAEFRRI